MTDTSQALPSDHDPKVLLSHYLKALKLPTFLREYDKIARPKQCCDHAFINGRHSAKKSVLR